MPTDDFDRADENPLAGNWSTQTGFSALQIVGNEVRGTNDADASNHSRWHAPVNDNQKCTITLRTNAAGNNHSRALVRCGLAAGSCYAVLCGIGASRACSLALFAPAFSDIATGEVRTSVAGDTFGVQAVGTTIKLFFNGTDEVYSVTDSTLTSGVWGMGVFIGTGGTVADAEIDNFEGINVTTGAGAPGYGFGESVCYSSWPG